MHVNYPNLGFIWKLTFLIAGGLLLSSLVSSPVDPNARVAEPIVWAQNRAPEVPSQDDLAGEAVPFESFGVREQLDREMVVNTYHHSSTMLYLKRASRWFPVIESILKEKGLPDDFKYLAVIESGLSQVVSPAGAAGFWQFMKGTAPQYGLRITEEIDERYHVVKSTYAACDYLLDANKEFGSWALAAASYNMGKAGVRRDLEEQKVDTYWELHLNSETARYVYRLLAIKAIFEDPESYGFSIQPDALYQPFETRTVWVTSSIDDLSAFALEKGANLKALKTLNPWLRSNRLTLAVGDSIGVKIPI
ncbi:MAG: murein transglycosylase [Crocinitomicaceae bacterium]|nr:murein transglycosylase [Crocinitomicaceae bacterium]